MDVIEKDKKYFGRGSDPLQLEIDHAEGSLIYDIDGKKYIDFLGGSGVGNFGWGNKEIELSIRNSKRPSYVYPNFYYKPWADLAELLAAVTPEHLTRCFRATGGSEAVEAAMQIAMMYTGRKKFISIEGSYHGNTLGALSLGVSSNKKRFPALLPGCEKVELPLDQKALEKIETHLQNKEVAAFFMEPVICNLGVIIPEAFFMEKLQHVCQEHGTLLVMDETITGFGRTGKLFASEHFNFKPDIMCLAKALSSGHAGIGAVITTNKVARAVEGKIGLYSSYGWHPVSTDAAHASINYLLNNLEDLFNNVEESGKIFRERISKMNFKGEIELRIKGFAIGVDVKDKDYASEIKEKAFQKGLLMNSEGSSLVFFPALNINKKTVEEGLTILGESV